MGEQFEASFVENVRQISLPVQGYIHSRGRYSVKHTHEVYAMIVIGVQGRENGVSDEACRTTAKRQQRQQKDRIWER